jgi:hypothetical protein
MQILECCHETALHRIWKKYQDVIKIVLFRYKISEENILYLFSFLHSADNQKTLNYNKMFCFFFQKIEKYKESCDYQKWRTLVRSGQVIFMTF